MVTNQGIADAALKKSMTHNDTNGTDMTVSANLGSVGSVNATPVSAQDKHDHIVAVNFLLGWFQTWVTKAIVTLRVPDILSKVPGPKKCLTVEKIVSHITCKNPTNAVSYLERMMRFMACREFFTVSTNMNNETEYGLNGVSKMFVSDSELSVVQWINICCHESTLSVLDLMHETVLSDICPWEMAHGLPIYAMNPKFPEFGDVFHKSMITHSNYLSRILAEEYSGFKNAKTLVDVGGSLGNNLSVIVRFHPHVRGINFDLPSVIAGAPALQDVEHVGGNFYESVPSGDLIMLMAVLHNNNDANCVKILETIRKALPDDGMLIVAEYIMSNDADVNAERVRLLDMIMLSHFRGGLERTFEQHQALYTAAGFKRCQLIKMSGPMDVIEVYKN
ncbi:hypothetical protein Mapa_017091 [Marchantia paleacea]|nr:hypothetical protein Mapa_017091 [Marchantia paleacea]